MARTFEGGRLVVASHNPGKVPEPEETGTTFAENAILKAKAAAEASGLPALSDDSGLAVTALNGAPGIYSARWGGPEKDFGIAMKRVNTELVGHDDRSAQFVCALCLAWPDGHVEVFEGTVEGIISWPPEGAKGFGYDPIFRPKGHAITFGQMEPEEKHAMSHRARAFAQLVDACFKA
jgi:XTP/dITP diphosphohydrolase